MEATKSSARYTSSEGFFKIKSNDFLDTLILNIFFDIIKTNNFRGDLSDISGEKTSLYTYVTSDVVLEDIPDRSPPQK